MDFRDLNIFSNDVCLSVVSLRSVLLLFLAVLYLFSSTLYLISARHFLSNVSSVEGNNRCAFAQRGVLLHGDIPSLTTGYEPNVLDDFHYSETSAMIFKEESADIDTEPSYSCDAELDDEIVGNAREVETS